MGHGSTLPFAWKKKRKKWKTMKIYLYIHTICREKGGKTTPYIGMWISFHYNLIYFQKKTPISLKSIIQSVNMQLSKPKLLKVIRGFSDTCSHQFWLTAKIERHLVAWYFAGISCSYKPTKSIYRKKIQAKMRYPAEEDKGWAMKIVYKTVTLNLEVRSLDFFWGF